MNYLNKDLKGKLIRLGERKYKEDGLNTSEPFLVVGGDGMLAKGNGDELVLESRKTHRRFRINSNDSITIVRNCVFHIAEELVPRVVGLPFSSRHTVEDDIWRKQVEYFHNDQARRKENGDKMIWGCPDAKCAYAER